MEELQFIKGQMHKTQSLPEMKSNNSLFYHHNKRQQGPDYTASCLKKTPASYGESMCAVRTPERTRDPRSKHAKHKHQGGQA